MFTEQFALSLRLVRDLSNQETARQYLETMLRYTVSAARESTNEVDRVHALTGRCDFLLTKSPSVDISSPVIAIFEAKDDNLDRWYGQCGTAVLISRITIQLKLSMAQSPMVKAGVFLCLAEQTLHIDTGCPT